MSANKAFYSLLAAFCIASVSLTILLVKSLPLTLAHAIYVCQETLAKSITLPHITPIILVLLATVIFMLGLLALITQIIKTRLYIRGNIKKLTATPEIVKIISHKLNLDGKIDIIKDKSQFSFCYGMIRPRICLSTGLIKKLNSDELKVVLLHESYHLKNHDPLKIVVAKATSYMFFFIPTIRDVQKYYALSKEIAADKVAVKLSQKEFLLSALSKLIINNPRFSGIAAFASSNDLEKRIKCLTEQKRILFRPSAFNLTLSMAVVLFSFIALNAPVFAMNMSDDQTMNNSYCVCPFGGACVEICKQRLNASKESSNDLLYSPVR